MKSCLRSISPFVHALAVLSLCGMAACSTASDDPVPVAPNGDQATYVSLSLSAARSAAPLRVPSGGENGDGLEHGQDYENQITSLTAFFYNAEGPNAPAATPIAGILYCGAEQLAGALPGIDSQWSTRPMPVAGLKPGIDYRVLIVANAGDLRGEGLTTLGSVRDCVMKRSLWTYTTVSGYSDFCMASADGDEMIVGSSGKGTQDDPVVTDRPVGIERLTARIDYSDRRTSLTTKGGHYQGTARITRAALANVPASAAYGTYLLKRVSPATDLSVAPDYLGDERIDAAGHAANYVIDPYTRLKTTAGYHADSLEWLSRYESPLATFTDGEGHWYDDKLTDGTVLTGEAQGYRRIGYALENVTAASEQSLRYCTAVVFEAQFVPLATAHTTMDGYQAGQTFIDFGGTLYRTVSQAIKAYYLTQGTDWAGVVAHTFSTTDTWGDVETYARSLPSNDPAAWREYLHSQAAGHAAGDQLDAAAVVSLTWSAYLRDVLQITESDAGVTTAVSADHGMTTRGRLHMAGTRLYYNGRCYYTYTIRHADDGDTATDGVMEYAIVRNNVYKLDINAIRDLGNDVPTDSGGITITVAVRNWSVLPPEKIEL